MWHSFVESPTAGDNIYRWKKRFVEGENYIELPDYYNYLNENTMVWICPVGHFGAGYGELTDEKTIKINVNQEGEYNILVIGTRKDADALKAWKGTETLITENEKKSMKSMEDLIIADAKEQKIKRQKKAKRGK